MIRDILQVKYLVPYAPVGRLVGSMRTLKERQLFARAKYLGIYIHDTLHVSTKFIVKSILI